MIDILKVTKKILFKEFHKIARQHGVKLNIKKISSIAAGEYYVLSDKINIDRDSVKRNLPFIFFHELGHSHCAKNNIWKMYHDVNNTWKDYKLTALKAEKWIDLWAEKEVNKFFKNVNCYKPYHSEYGVKQFRLWVLKNEKK